MKLNQAMNFFSSLFKSLEKDDDIDFMAYNKYSFGCMIHFAENFYVRMYKIGRN